MRRKALKELVLRTRFFNASPWDIFRIKSNQLIILYIQNVLIL